MGGPSKAGTCPLSRRLQDYIAGAVGASSPEAVAAKTRLHILDTIAAIVSGRHLRAGTVSAAYVSGLGGREEATVIATPHLASAIDAALANAMAAHADETDDSHLAGRFHPGCAVLPAALAMAERNGANGRALTAAVALGYDIGARFTLALGYSGPRTGIHSTHMIGANFGATAAAGALAGFTPQQVGHLISYAVQQASGLPYWQRDTEHVEKAFDFGGMGARNAVSAALMVAAGFAGVADVVTGEHSYLSAFAEKAEPEALIDGLGERFEIMAASIKKWSVGSPIQSALDAMTALVAEHALIPANVAEIRVHTPDDRVVVVDDRDMPDVCLQHAVAVALIDGTMSFAAAHDVARMADPAVRAVRARMTVVPSPELTRARPERQSIIEVTTTDGRKLRHHAVAVRGTPDNPMTAAEVETKALDLMAPVLGEARARELVARIGALDDITDVRTLRPLLQS
jgi:2-methylcitrate dehydratase PrpD